MRSLIKSALKDFHPSEPTWSILKKLYDETAPVSDRAAVTTPCDMCGNKCGRTVRECATIKAGSEAAGRKALKDCIRARESLGGSDDVLERLFDVYLKVSIQAGSKSMLISVAEVDT